MNHPTMTASKFGPVPALRQLFPGTRWEWLYGAAWLLITLGIYSGRARWDKLALFSCLVLAAALGQAGAYSLRWLLPKEAGWVWCWLAQPFLWLGAGTAATQAYRFSTAHYQLRALSDLHMFGSAAAFVVLVVTIPLMISRRDARVLQMAELQRAAVQAELKSLQAQVEPHFLYNTLANTRYLARHAPERAVEMLDHLIAYLRTALPDMRTPTSTLGRECELVGHYLALMEIRFGERLSTRIDCPDALRAAQVPPMMLMSLVENAVQHGVEPKPGQVRVSVMAAEHAGQLHITVRDDGAGLQQGLPVLGSGVGLRNVRERLQALYEGRAAFELRQAADGATEAELRLPLEQLQEVRA
ncbi:histidine kinase [Massilia sp. SR12]